MSTMCFPAFKVVMYLTWGANGFLGISDSVTVSGLCPPTPEDLGLYHYFQMSDPGSEGEEAFRASRADPA